MNDLLRHKWGHYATFNYSKGRVRITCECGKASPLYRADELGTADEKAVAWFQAHTGLIEQEGRRR